MPDAERENGLPKIGNPALRALSSVGITRLSQVSRMSKKALAERGLSFKEQRP